MKSLTDIAKECGIQFGESDVSRDIISRRQLERVIAAALAQHQAKALEGVEPVACLVETEQGVMVWPIADLGEASTYCDEGEFPELLYPAATVSALQARIAELEALLQEAGRTIDNLTVFAGRSGQSIHVRAAIDAARKEYNHG